MTPTPRTGRSRLRVLAAGALSAPLVVTGAAAAPAGAAAAVPSADLQEAVTTDGVLEHLRALQSVADANAGNRAAGTAGYDASAQYVADQLEDAGYDVALQEFTFPFFEERSAAVFERTAPTTGTYTPGTDFATMAFSGSGDVTAPVTPVAVQFPPTAQPGATASGCQPADFAGFPAGSIALVQRGLCTFGVKARNAADAGAAAVVIANEGQEGRTDALTGTLEAPAGIPVIGTTSAVGAELAAGGVTARVRTDTVNEERTTRNVIADSPGGTDQNVVVVGAHLDSVTEGPGTNDNGSGSAAILEVAQELAEAQGGDATPNRVRFAFWGAEELGLLGSAAYVESLSADELVDLALYLNFDMVGSPNYVRGVYDGDGSSFDLRGPAGSSQIEALFNEHFEAADLPFQGTEFSGRSDYQAFITNGIPAGGLFTGAEEVKTEEEAALYGGVAGAALDPCYHQACDTLADGAVEGRDPAVYGQLADLVGNVSTVALDTSSDAIAHAVATYAQDTSSVNGVPLPAGEGGTEGGGASAPAVPAS